MNHDSYFELTDLLVVVMCLCVAYFGTMAIELWYAKGDEDED